MNKDPDTIQFVLNGCDISFYAEAPSDMTVKQLIEQADRIVPDWCACGVRSRDMKYPAEIIFTYDDVWKTSDDVCCRILEKGKSINDEC